MEFKGQFVDIYQQQNGIHRKINLFFWVSILQYFFI